MRIYFSNKLAMNSICQHCGKTFADKHKLAVHSLNHAKDEIKCHICEKICIGNKKFQNTSNFTKLLNVKIVVKQSSLILKHLMGKSVKGTKLFLNASFALM